MDADPGWPRYGGDSADEIVANAIKENGERARDFYLDHWREFNSIAMLISAAKVSLGIPTDVFKEKDYLEQLVLTLVADDAEEISSGYVIVSKQDHEGEEPIIRVSLDLGEVQA